METDPRVAALVADHLERIARGEDPSLDDFLAAAGPLADLAADALDLALAEAPGVAAPNPATVAHFERLLAAGEPSPIAANRPTLLDLRHRRALSVDGVTAALQERLGIAAAHRARLRVRYQDLEGGRLPLHAISARLRTALAAILAVGEDELTVPTAAAGGPVFARSPAGWSPAAQRLADVAPEAPDDLVDRLFGLADAGDPPVGVP